MNIKTSANPDGENTFSEDVLKIEKCGPDEDYLTIIDVPGIFRRTTQGVTTNEDKILVKEMVKRYIKDDRTIILAVLPCNIDVATQEILTLAAEADPTGDRTLGILTKADLLKEESAKLSVVKLLKGDRMPLKLGYHAVTNRGGDDHGDEADPAAAQRKRESMFEEHPWNTVSEDRRGVSTLRERLEDLLGEITDRAFPELRAEVRQRLADVKKELNKLGASRQTEHDQQRYLVGIAGKFQALVRAALDADYSADQAFDKNQLRLITAIVNVTEQFGSDFDNFARTYLFQSELRNESEAPRELAFPESPVFQLEESLKLEATKDDDDNEIYPTRLDRFDVPDPTLFPDLDKVITKDWIVELPKKGIMKWIEVVHHRSRSLDLGSLGQGVLRSVFREQSAKWEEISKQYLSQVILLVHRFILEALEVVCADTQTLKSIASAILSDLCAKYEDAMNQVTFLADVERQLKPYTLNHYFNHNQQRAHASRMKETLRSKARVEAWDVYGNKLQDSNLVLNLDDVEDAVTNKSNATHAKETIHDHLQAYYRVAHKRFVDNVFSQAVDYKLLSGPESPLSLFSENWVLGLDKEELLSVAGESRRTRERREKLTKEVVDFQDAMDILR